MKLKVNTIGSTYTEYITKHIAEYSIPICFGAMELPILSGSVDVLTDCIKPKNLVKKEDIACLLEDVLDETIPGISVAAYCVTKEGVEYIEGIKENIAKKYVDKIVKCSSCELFDKCNAVTTHTLKRIELEVLYNKT